MATGTLRGSAGGYVPWTRPTDWLALPVLTAGQEKVVALAAVYPAGGNVFAVNCNGAYTVDWGDGTVENVATGVQRNHTYTYASLSANDTTEGWRQAIVSITPQAANSLTSVNFGIAPTGTSSGYLQQWRDVAMVGANVATLTMGLLSGINSNAMRQFTYVGPSSIASLPGSFRALPFLKTIVGTQWTATVTSFSQTFQGCGQLELLPLLDTHAATTFSQTFSGCTALRSIPLFNTGNVTDFSTAFNGCVNLGTVPLLDTSKATAFSSMFSGCSSLTTIPLLVTTLGAAFTSMFQNCGALASVPALDLGNGTGFNSMFNGCVSLVTLPAAFNTAKGTDFGSMFSGCSSMVSHPAMTVTLGTIFTSMFVGCLSLGAINLPTSTAGTTFASMAQSCVSLKTINLNMAAASSQANSTLMGAGTTIAGLTSLTFTGLRFAPTSSLITANQQLTAAAMNALYTSLGTASGAQTLVVSGNPGSGSSTIATATAKGWTVTGG